MKNKEKYLDEMLALFNKNKASCSFKKEYVIKNCDDIDCIECDKLFKSWLEEEYIEPEPEINWEKVPVDTPVYVSDADEFPNEKNFSRHFSTYFKGNTHPFGVWAEGKTSFTTSKTISYKYCSLARKEDIEKYKKE